MRRVLVVSLACPAMLVVAAASAQEKPCAGDVAKFCGNVKQGEGRIAKCLKQNKSHLSRKCKECGVLAACRGGCPKHRFEVTPYNEPGLHYLCPGYKKFFRHIRKYLRAITQLLENGLPASYVMDAVKGPLVVKLGDSQDWG